MDDYIPSTYYTQVSYIYEIKDTFATMMGGWFESFIKWYFIFCISFEDQKANLSSWSTIGQKLLQ